MFPEAFSCPSPALFCIRHAEASMLLKTLLPRDIDPHGGSECATIMGAVLTAVHLDRRAARALGFRGIRPSGTDLPAWTCRIAGADPVFGLVFEGEALENGHAGDAVLTGSFAVYAFPSPESALLDVFPLEAMRTAMSPDYEERVRNLSGHAESLGAFRLGTMYLKARTDGTGAALGLKACARLRCLSLDGVCVPGTEANPDWLVEPGTYETDVPAYAVLLPFFSAVAASMEAVLGRASGKSSEEGAGQVEDLSLAIHIRKVPVPCFDRNGAARDPAGRTGHEIDLWAALGSIRMPGRKLHRLPMRHKARKDETGLPVLHILTGFLGAGKTTFLRQWLDYLHGRERYTGVIQNELGQIGLDAALMHRETMVEQLDDGCVCCSLADSIRPGLERLIKAMPAEQFILETSGVANPDNVMACMNDLCDLVEPGLVITVADALHINALQMHQKREALSGIQLSQVQHADVLVVSKADLLDDAACAAVAETLRSINKQALILQAKYGSVPFGELDAFYSAWLDGKKGSLPSHTRHLETLAAMVTHQKEGYEARVLPLTHPLTEDAVQELIKKAGPGLARAKGIVDIVADDGETVPLTVQYASGRLAYEKAPETDERYLVFIGTGIVLPDEEGRLEKGGSIWN